MGYHSCRGAVLMQKLAQVSLLALSRGFCFTIGETMKRLLWILQKPSVSFIGSHKACRGRETLISYSDLCMYILLLSFFLSLSLCLSVYLSICISIHLSIRWNHEQFVDWILRVLNIRMLSIWFTSHCLSFYLSIFLYIFVYIWTYIC